MSKVLLYSGGTDSWLIDKLWKPDKRIYIDICGMYSEAEMKMLPTDVEIIQFPFLGTTEEHDTAYVPMRNLYFLMIASNYGSEVCLGATGADAGSHDKDEKFLKLTQDIFNYCLIGNSFTKDRHIHVEDKYIHDGKYSLLRKYLEAGGSLETFVNDTFTCHHPVDDKPCMNCKLCAKKFLLAYYYGYKFSNETEEKMLNYMIKNMLPKTQKNGTYFSERPLDGIYAFESAKKFLSEKGKNIYDYI